MIETSLKLVPSIRAITLRSELPIQIIHHSRSRSRFQSTASTASRIVKRPFPTHIPGNLSYRTIYSSQVLGAGLLLTTAAAASTYSAEDARGQRDLTSAMSSKLIPKNPSDVMVIRNVTPNVVTLSVPFLRAGLFRIGGRGTIVRLTSGALAVFSPVALTPEVKAKIAELGGTVRYIVALDIEHHIFVSDWAAAFPEATLIGPEGLPEKRAKAKDEKIGKEAFAVVFAAKGKRETRVDAEFDRDFDYEYIESHPNKELVFYYRPDRVLIEADLMFNLPPTEQYSRVPEAERPSQPGVLERWFASVQTTQGDAKGTKRFLWYLVSAKDRKGFNESVQRIGQWDFDTIVPCHGDVIQGDGKAVFEKVFEWHLKGTKA